MQRLEPMDIQDEFDQAVPVAAGGGGRGVLPVLQVEQWGVPSRLPPAVPEVPELPMGLMPDSLWSWIADAGDRAQVPPEFIAAPALVALGGLIGRSVAIRPKQRDDWLVVPNLWGMLIGRPGVLKTPAVSEALRPLNRLAAEAKQEFEDGAAQQQARQQILKAQVGAAQDAAKAAAKSGDADKLAGAEADLTSLNAEMGSAETTERRYITNDGTVEKIGELLNQNPRGLLVVRDELSGWLRNLEKAGREGDREFYLESWNGTGRFTYDRIGRGTLHIDALCLSIIGTIQPGKLQSHIMAALNGGAGDDGLLQRFQVAVWPDIRGDWRNVDRWPNTEARDRAYDIYRRLGGLAGDDIGAEPTFDGIPALRFAPDAQELFDEWRGELEQRLRSPDMERTPGFESHLAKYRSLQPSIAMVLHLADVVDGRAKGAVSLDAARQAAAWCEFLESHARRIYASEVSADLYVAQLLMDKIKAGAIADGNTIRDIYQSGWSGLTTPEQLRSGLEVLANHNLATVEEQATGGRPTEVVRLNPNLRGAGR